MHSKAIIQCPACGDAEGWRFAEAAYVRALLEEDEQDLTEDRGVVKVCCGNCGYVISSMPRRSASGGCGKREGGDLKVIALYIGPLDSRCTILLV